jgi:hypothetical protein
MVDNMNIPEDWGVADKKICMPAEVLSGSGGMPALEGRDIVGFSERISFAAIKLKPNKPEGVTSWFDVQNRPVIYNPSTKSWYHKDESGQKDLQKKLNQPNQQTQQVRKQDQKPKETQKQVTETQKVSQLTPQKEKTQKTPKSARSRADNFNLELTESNQDFFNRIRTEGKWNGTEFVDLRATLGDQTAIPPRHLDALSRMLITQGSDTTAWSDFGGDVKGGAGKIYAQAGELMTLAFSSLPPEQSKKLQEIIQKTLDAQKASKTKKQIITQSWFQAAQDNSVAINHAIKSNYGEDVSVIAGAWDVKGEVEELGMKDYDSEKGFSTDIYLKLSDGSLAQISLKKDVRVNFLNSGAGNYGKFIISAHAKDPDSPYYERAKAYINAVDTRKTILENLPPKINAPRKKDGPEVLAAWQRANNTISEVESESWARPDDSYNNSIYSQNEEERLRNVISSRRDQIKAFDLSSIDTDERSILNTLYEDNGINADELSLKKNELKKLVKEGKLTTQDQERILNNQIRAEELAIEAKKTASDNAKLIEKANKVMKKRGLSWPELVDTIASQNVINRDSRKLIHLAAINQNIEGYKDSVQIAHKNFISSAIEAINTSKYLRDGMLEELKNNFPIRDVAEGKEIMAIGDLSFNAETCRDIFGTSDFEVIKTGFKVTIAEDGTPYLGWVGRAGNGPILPIAKINVRQDGVGYGGGNIKHEMVLHSDFANRLRQSNAKEYGAGFGRTFSEPEFKEPEFDEQEPKKIKMENKKPTFEDYMEILKAKRASTASGGGANYADSMVFYRGKALGRCPAGTTRSGRTCVPSTSTPSKAPGYKQQDLGGLSQAQVKALSKAKSTKDIIEAHKKHNKK